MSDIEKSQIGYLIQKVEEQHKYVNAELADIKLGLYGNKKNKITGLIDRQDDDERRIKILEDNGKKVKWLGAGFVVALQTIGIAIWEYITNK